MKKILCFLCAVLLLLSFVGCDSETIVTIDYEDVTAFESALNAGEDLTGKTVRFTVNDFAPQSAFGYNMQTGEHLNFCSTSNPKVSIGDTVTVKVVEVSSFLGSWIISYEMIGSAAGESPVKQVDEDAEPVKDYGIGETWTVDGQWTLTVDSVQEISERNPYTEKNPAAVYIVFFTYSNLGYSDANGIMDGLYFDLEDSIVDCTGLMGYSYPGDITDYPQETPVGATCKGQACIGVDNAGFPVKLNVMKYDGNGQKRTATFILN